MPDLPAPAGFTRDVFRTALSRFASGVTVVTAALGDEISGMTVSAFSSIALEPALIMVALTEDKHTSKLVKESGWFAVNVLRANQQDLSEAFAWRDVPNRFDGIDWAAGPHGIPILAGTLATLVCRVDAIHVGGDHLIVIGEAVTGTIGNGEPLVYSQGRYHRLSAD